MNLLGRARKIWQGLGPATPPKPQYYDVACAEGHRLQGERRESYQALRCPVCGRGIFILPVNPLPDPPAPRSKGAAASAVEVVDEGPIPLQDAPEIEPGTADEAEAEAVEWLDPEPDEGPRDDGFEAIIPEPAARSDRKEPAVRPRPAPAKSRGTSPVGGPPEVPEVGIVGKNVVAIPAASNRSGRRRHLLLLAGVVAVVAATVGYRSWRLNLQNLPQQAEADLAEGRKALENGDFTNAKFKLGEAARAFERLGADRASETRQAASETAILADLISVSVEELLQEASRAKSPADWAERFDRQYKGQSILIEDELSAPEEGSSAPFGLSYRVLFGAKPTVGRIDLTGLTLFGGKSFKAGTRVTFGARLSAVQLQPDGRWRIALEPDSGVLITDFKPLSFLGWGLGESAPPEGGAR